MSTITAVDSQIVEVQFGVYVRDGDKANDLPDIKDYTFGVNESGTYIPETVDHIEELIRCKIQTISFPMIADVVDALYNQDVEAIIINEALVDVLIELDEFIDFPARTRQISVISFALENDFKEDNALEKNTPTENFSASEESSKVGITNTPFICYLSGSDTRNQMLTTSRSDVNIIAAVNPATRQILLINTPRDYYVANPAAGGKLDKLTHCGIYGIDCSMQALEELYQMEINYYAQINFTGFKALIDAVGGVTVYSDLAFAARDTNICIGENVLDGAGALDYARERYALTGGDNDRGKNQMKVIEAVLQKLSVETILTNYLEILEGLEGMLITDISIDEITDLVKMQLSNVAPWSVFTYSVTGTGGKNVTYSMPGQPIYIMYPDNNTVTHATKLINCIMAGNVLTSDDVGDSG